MTCAKTTGCISTIYRSRFDGGRPVLKILSRWFRFTIVLFFNSVRYILVAFPVVVREPLFACCVVFCWVSRDTDDKTTVMCMLCCSMVRRTESVERSRNHGVDCRRVAPPSNGDHDLFFGLVTAEQRYIGWNALLWPSWSQDDEKWKSRLTWRLKKCFHWTSGRVAPQWCVVYHQLLTWSTSAEHVRNRAEEFMDCCRHVVCVAIEGVGSGIDHEQDNLFVHRFSVVCSDACRLFRRVGDRFFLF